VLVPGLAPTAKLGVFNNTLDVAHKALAERYYRCKVGEKFEPPLPTTDDKFIDRHMRQFIEKLTHALNLRPEQTIDEVVASYKGPKRKVYENAARKYWRDGISKMDATLRMFVKFEKCDLSKAPRVINPRAPVFNLGLGRHLKHNEHEYFDAIAKVFTQSNVVIKGMDAFASANAIREEWAKYCNPCSIGGDATKFDMHVRPSALRFEHLCYLRPRCSDLYEAEQLYDRMLNSREQVDVYEGVESLAWQLAQQVHNKGKAYFDDGIISFRMDGTRASGDLNTSLGNCLIMSGMTYAWKETQGIEMSLANNGDDCSYIMDAKDEQRWRTGFAEFYAEKGFRMELEPTAYELERIEFCQSHPINTVEGWKMVRNPATLVTKASMCLNPVRSMKDLRKWIMAVGVAEGSLNRGVPIIQSFARAMRRVGFKCSHSHIVQAYRQSTRVYHADLVVNDREITPEARRSFHAAWGICPEDQVHLERYYDRYQLAKNFMHPLTGEEALERVGVPHHPIMQLLDPTI